MQYTMLPVKMQGEAEFHRASDEDLQRGPQRDSGHGRGIEASDDDDEHAQPAPRQRRACRDMARAYTSQCKMKGRAPDRTITETALI